jgi:thiol-disulfide isomerase/thioredoxin
VTPGYWALAVALAAALTLGLAKHWYDGRFRATASRAADGIRLTRDDIGADLGGRATLVQFSTAFCAPCRATRQVLRSVAGQLDGVEHVEVDAESTLELVRRLEIMRTPTTLILDRQGRVTTRASGPVGRDQVLAALSRVGVGRV